MELDQIMERAISNVFAHKLQAGDLDADTWKANVSALWAAIDKATGNPFDNINVDHPLRDLATALRESAMVFAAFKNHHNIADLVDALTDDVGKLRPFAIFREVATTIQEDYNLHWLEAEYNTAVASGQMAVKWQDFQGNQAALPYLRFVTVGDARVRRAHQLLDGTTRHIDDAFWDEWMPPVGWNCRCDVQQVAGGETALPEQLPDEKQAPPAFRFNAGKTRQLFGPEHPYFQGFSEEQRAAIIEAMQKLPQP